MYRVELELGAGHEAQYLLVRHWSEAPLWTQLWTPSVVYQLHCEWSGLLKHFLAPELKMQCHTFIPPALILVKFGW